MREYRENWDAYTTRVQGVSTSIFLDLGRIVATPDNTRPTLVRLLISCHERRENGFPSKQDFEVLYELEEAIIEFVKSKTEWVHVGAVTDSRGREIVFYAPAVLELNESDFAFVPADRRGDEFWGTDEDPEWGFYRDFMFPKPHVFRKMQDDHVLENLRKDGDRHDIVRRVDHWIHFTDTRDRQRFLDWAISRHFALEQMIDPDAERQLMGVQIHHESSVLPGVIHPIIGELDKVAREMNGTYDGWETFVMRDAT